MWWDDVGGRMMLGCGGMIWGGCNEYWIEGCS
jgi:hypothetical protein